jgi:phage-related protein
MRIGLGYNFSANTKAFNKNVAALNTSISDLNASIQSMLSGVASASKGSTRAIKNTSSALRGASDDATRLANDGETAVTKLAKLFDALDPTDLVRAPFDKAQDLINKLSESRGQFVSSITQAAIQFDKGFAGMAANAGLFGKELRRAEGQISSAARSLNMDAGELGKNFLALRKVGITPEDLGLNGLQDLGRVLEVTGLSGEDLGNVFTNLTRSYGFTKEGAVGFLDTFTKQVTALGIGTEAFGGLVGMMTTMDEAFATTLKAEGPEAVQKMILSATRLGAAMTTAIGGTQQENLTHAIDLFKNLSENANVLPKMMAGIDGEFGPLLQKLAVGLPGGFSEAMDALKKGTDDPLTFAKNMTKLYSDLKKGGPRNDVLLQQLSDTVTQELGPGFEYFFEAGDNAVAALEAMQKPIEGGIKSLRELGKEGYRTGLTLDDQLARIKENFEHTFKSIAYPDAREFVKSQRAAYAEVGAAVKTLAAGKGLDLFTKQLQSLGASQEQIAGVNDTLSKLTRAASLMQSGGLAAALQPFIGDTGKLSVAISAIGAASEAFSPLSEFLASVGINVSDLLVPFTYLKNLLLAGGPFGMLTPMLAALGPWGIGIGAVVVAVGALTAAMWGVDEAMSGAFGPIAQNIVTKIRDTLLEGVQFLQGFLTEQLKKAMEVDPKLIADRITNSISLAVASLSAYLNGESASSPLGSALMGLLGTAKDLALRVRDIVERVIDEVPWAALTKSLLSVVVPWLKDSLWSAFTNGDNWLMLGSFLMETLVHGITRQFTMTFSVISGIRDVLTYAIENLTEFLFDKGVEIVAWISRIFYGEEESNAWLEQAASFKQTFGEVYDWLKSLGASLDETFFGAVSDAFDFVLASIPNLTSLTDWLSEASVLAKSFGETAGEYFDLYVRNIKDSLGTVLPLVSPLFAMLKMLWGGDEEAQGTSWWDSITSSISEATSLIDPFYGWLMSINAMMSGVFAPTAQGNLSATFDPLKEIGDYLVEIWPTVASYIDAAVTAFSSFYNKLVAAWPQTKETILISLATIFQSVTSLKDKLIEVFNKLFSAESPLLALFRLFVNNAKTSFQVFYDLVTGFPAAVVSAFEWIAESIGAVLSKGAELVQDHFGSVTDALYGVFESILDVFVGVFGKVTATIEGIADVFRSLSLGSILGIKTTGTNSTSSDASAQATYDANLAKGNAQGIIAQLKSEGDQTRAVLRDILSAIRGGQLQAIPSARPGIVQGPAAATPRR